MKHDQTERRLLQAAERTVAELERKRAAADTAYGLTGHPRHERERFLLDATLDRARQIRRLREKDLKAAEERGTPIVSKEHDEGTE